VNSFFRSPYIPAHSFKIPDDMKKIYTFCIIAFAVLNSKAQVGTYSFSATQAQYVPLATETVLATATNNGSGSINNQIFHLPDGTIPFPFVFNGYGAGYTGLYISSNGFVTFGLAPSAATYRPLSGNEGYTGAVSALGTHINGFYNIGFRIGQISYGMSSTAGIQEFVIQWKNFQMYDTAVSHSYLWINFQIRLAINGTIRMHYQSGYVGGVPMAASAEVGLRGPNNTFPANVNNRKMSSAGPLAWYNSSSGTLNDSDCTVSNNGFPNCEFIWTPTTTLCMVPNMNNVEWLSATTAKVSWNGAGTSIVEWGPINCTPGIGSTHGICDNILPPGPSPQIITGLVPGVLYNVNVRQDCTVNLSGYSDNNNLGYRNVPHCPNGSGSGSVIIPSLPYSAAGQTTCGAGNGVTAEVVQVVGGDAAHYAGEDKTYIFTPTVSGVHKITLTSAVNANAGMVLYQGCPFTPGSSVVGFAQDNTGLTNTLFPMLSSGVAYYLVVDNMPLPGCISSYNLSIDVPGPSVVTTLLPGSCGVALTSIGSLIGIQTVGVQPITGYRIRLTNGLQVQVIERTVPHFTIPQFPSYDYATTYTVEIQLQRAGIWQTAWGAPCLVSTPAILEEGGAASISASQCGIILTKINTLIATTSIPGVTGYRFRIMNLTDPLSSQAVQQIDRTQNWFSLPMLGRYNYGTTYRIEVAVKTTGTYSGFGAPCEVSSPYVPMLVNCGASVAHGTTPIATTSVSGAAQYRFQIMRISDNVSATIDTNANWFIFDALPASAFSLGTLYSVRVAVLTTGSWSPFGDICTITSPVGTARIIEPVDKSEITSEFKAHISPNPFGTDFTIKIQNPSDQDLQLLVYDMLGRNTEVRTIILSELEHTKIGIDYPTGIYNIIVKQGNQSQALRIIKR
jgi:hypothetical protein